MTPASASAGALAAGAVLLLLARPTRRSSRLPATRPAGPAHAWPARLGACLRRAGLRDSPLGDATLTAAAGALLGLAAVVPPVAALAAVGIWVHAQVHARRLRRQHVRAIAQALPDTVDLLRLCTGAGLSLALAHPLVADRAPQPLAAALARADAAARRGSGRADALRAHLAPLGEGAAALAHVLADHLCYGAPLEPALDRLGLELRLERRRRAEVEARRVPVRLLAPLVSCTLPAFALLTVVPLLAASFEALPA